MTMPPMARQFQSLLVGLATLKPVLMLLSSSVATTRTFLWPLEGTRSAPRWNPPMRSTASQMSRSLSLRVVQAKTWRSMLVKRIAETGKEGYITASDKAVAAPSFCCN